MATTTRVLRHIIIPSIFALVLLMLSTAVLIFPSLSPDRRLWSEHYTLLVPEAMEPLRVVAALADVGLSSVVAEPTALVRFNSVTRLETITVGEIADRFEPVDPRLDPYMARLPAFFHSLNGRRPMRIYYVRTILPPLAVHGRVTEALSDLVRGSLVVEWGIWRAALYLGAFACYVLILVLRSATERTAVLAAALVWVPWVFAGAASTFIVACLSVFLFTLWYEEFAVVIRGVVGRRRSTSVELRRLAVRSGFSFGATVGIIVVLGVTGREGLIALAFAGSGGAAIAGGTVYHAWMTRAHRDHPPFEPVDILWPSLWDALKGRHGSPVLSITPFVLLPLLVLSFLPKASSPFVPEPRSVAGASDFAKQSLEVLWTHEEANGLPDLADFLAHRAYQEGFLYGRGYGLPDGELTIPRFRLDGVHMIRFEEALARYDDEWYRLALDSPPDPSIASLLIAQGRPTSVVFTPVALILSRDAALGGHFLLILFVFGPFVISFTPAVPLGRMQFRPAVARGKRQEA